MKTAFQKIGLISKRGHEHIADTLKALYLFLVSHHKTVVFDAETALLNGLYDVPCVAEAELGQRCDLLIVVGGDGSLLSAAGLAVASDIPIIGINRGRLGFLTDISPVDFEKQLLAVFRGEYWEEARFLLDLTLHNANPQATATTGCALNDIVLKQSNSAHLLEFEITINQQFVCSERSDGLIIATPTGSTAYALSGGGPILHPQLNALVLMPMFSHTLSSRPIVVDGNSEICIALCENQASGATLHCDGQPKLQLEQGQFIRIQKALNPLRLLHPKDYNYFETLRTKLGWGRSHSHSVT